MMFAYIYQAALLCADCGAETRATVLATARRQCPGPSAPNSLCVECGFDPEDEQAYDSAACPKGPYDLRFHESDTPEHCDHCGAFLANRLTEEGRRYVREAIDLARHEPQGHGESVALTEWAPFYDLGGDA